MRIFLRSHIVFLLFTLLTASGLQAQDPSLSHFFANPLYLNPALSGTDGPARLFVGYRNQWPGATSPYVTYHASWDQYIDVLQGGVGLHIMNDRQGGGVFNTLSVDAAYSYHLKVSPRLQFTGGLQVSMGQRNMNPDGLVLPEELTGTLAGSLYGYSRLYPDFSAGISFAYRDIYGGFATHHLLQPYLSPTDNPDARLWRRYTLHAGTMIPVFEKRFGTELLQLSPNLIFEQQGIYHQMNYGLEVIYRGLLGGVWFRQDLRFSTGTLIFSAGYSWEMVSVRYSYDAKLSSPEIHVPSMGAHEISMVISFENLKKSTKPRAIKSPRF